MLTELCFYFLECFQVNVDCNLCSEFIGQVPQHFLFIYCLLIGPEVVKPADDALLQHLAHMSEVHVVFQGVYSTLESCSRCVHVGNHGSDITHDGGKNQNTHLGWEYLY